MDAPLDVPSPIDLQSRQDATEWAQTAMAARPWRTEFFECLAAEISKMHGPLRVLELGSGPGFLAEHLLARLPNVSMVLLDFSGPMHDLARARLAPFLDRVQFVERSFKDADWADSLRGSFDVVVTNQAVHELRHKRHASALHRQVRKVLGPHGRYLVSDHHTGEDGMRNTELYMSIDEHHEALTAAGYRSVTELMRKGGMVLNRAEASAWLNCHVRQATAEDAPAIEGLYRQLVSNPAVSVSADRLAQIEQDSNTALFVGEVEGKVIGTALVSLCADAMFQSQPFAVIENVVVDAARRDQGAGRAIMQTVETFCLEAHCSKIMLLSASDRVQAHTFFERMGFGGSSKRAFVKYRSQLKR